MPKTFETLPRSFCNNFHSSSNFILESDDILCVLFFLGLGELFPSLSFAAIGIDSERASKRWRHNERGWRDPRHRDFFMALKMYKEYSTANSYSADYFIFLRPDMILKRNLFSDWDIAKGNIAFPFRASCNQTDHGCPADIPKKMCYRVPDRMIAMPRRAVEFIQRPEGHKVAIDFSHWTYIQLLNADDKWIRNHITFWLGEGHDADSAKEQNPIYTIAGRKEHSSRRDYACKGNP